MHNIIILRIGGNEPFLRRPDLLFFSGRSRRAEAEIDQIPDLFHRYRAVQKDRDPVPSADMIAREVSVLLHKHIRKHKIVQLHIQDIDAAFTGKAQILTRDVHNQPIPFPVIFMAEDRVIREAPPEVLRLTSVFPFHISVYLFPDSQFPAHFRKPHLFSYSRKALLICHNSQQVPPPGAFSSRHPAGIEIIPCLIFESSTQLFLT